MKIAVHVPIFGRRSIFERFLSKIPPKIDVYAATSTLQDFNFCLDNKRIKDATLTINDMDLKCQSLLSQMRGQNIDAIIFLGCDDFVHPEFWQILPQLLITHDLIAFKNIYFHDTVKSKTWLWPGYQTDRRKDEPAGAGRVIRADLLDKIDWKLWHGPYSEDAQSWHNIKAKMQAPLFLDCTKPGFTFVDVKDKESSTKINQFNYLTFIQDDEHIKRII